MNNKKSDLSVKEIEEQDKLADEIRTIYKLDVRNYDLGEIFKKMRINVFELSSFDAEKDGFSIGCGDGDRENFRKKINENNVKGFLYWNNNSLPEIFVDQSRDYYGRMFTAFHELGHLINLLLENGWKVGDSLNNYPLYKNYVCELDEKGNSVNHQENIINEFAGAMILPRNEVENILEFANYDVIDAIDFTKRFFGANLKSARHRIENISRVIESKKYER